MNLPEIKPYEEQAIDKLVNIINRAKSQLGVRQNIFELASSRNDFLGRPKVSLNKLESPLVRTCEQFITDTITKTWKLTPLLMYVVRYMGSSQDECAHYLYYKAIFSQPTASYPVPQATVSVFFRVEDKHLEPSEVKGVPMMTFRIEGQHLDHDVRYVLLTVDWVMAVLKMKIDLFKRIEKIKLF